MTQPSANALRAFKSPLKEVPDNWEPLSRGVGVPMFKNPKPNGYANRVALLGKNATRVLLPMGQKQEVRSAILASPPDNVQFQSTSQMRKGFTPDGTYSVPFRPDGVAYVNPEIFELTKRQQELFFA